MKKKCLAVLLLAFGLTLFSGCSSTETAYSKKESNFLAGAFKSEKGAYERVGPLTFGLKSSELASNADYDGDSVVLFWGLFTFVNE